MKKSSTDKQSQYKYIYCSDKTHLKDIQLTDDIDCIIVSKMSLHHLNGHIELPYSLKYFYSDKDIDEEQQNNLFKVPFGCKFRKFTSNKSYNFRIMEDDYLPISSMQIKTHNKMGSSFKPTSRHMKANNCYSITIKKNHFWELEEKSEKQKELNLMWL